MKPLIFLLLLTPMLVLANDDEVQDMSDPLAVYTQAGVGVTDKGVNFKVGQSYDTGNEQTAAMNIIEAKGLLGDTLGWRSDMRTSQSLDSFRFRNFNVTLPKGQAKQLDINYNFRGSLVADESADISYSFIQALPAHGALSFYPLAGVGLSVGKDRVQSDGGIDDGYALMGSYGLLGMYSKWAISDNIWVNYNPFWLTTLTGSSQYRDNYYGAQESTLLTHEFALSYQLTPRMNLRYFANWNENTDFFAGDHRLEFNYQL